MNNWGQSNIKCAAVMVNVTLTLIMTDNLAMWKTNITDIVRNEIGDKWNQYFTAASANYGNAKGLQKNPLAISHALEAGWNEGYKSTLLQNLIEKIVTF